MEPIGIALKLRTSGGEASGRGKRALRVVGGHAVFVHRGLEAAAQCLGDNMGSVEGVYAALKGELVDTSMLE